jgi:hypothetical protein
MAYTTIPLLTKAHLETLRRMWMENSAYDTRTSVCARERFEWLYQKSDSRRAQTWLAVETGHEAVVGYGSVVRSDRYFRGRMFPAGLPVVFVVDKAHRLAAAALAIQRALLAGGSQSGFEVMAAKPNDKSRPIVARVGYQMLGDLVDWVKFIGADGDLPERSSTEYVGEIVTVADGRFDDLWNRAKDRYPMVAEQTAGFLNWRYSGFKENYRFYCLLRTADRQLLGYVVFYGMTHGVVISQLFCEQPCGPLLDDLILGFCAQMKAEGRFWVNVHYFGSSSFKDQIEHLGFVRRKHRCNFMVYLDPAMDPDWRTALLDENNWFLFGGEMDVMLHDEVWRDISTQVDQSVRPGFDDVGLTNRTLESR